MSQASLIKEFTEEITANRHIYELKMGGTLDGFNTTNYLETYGRHMRQESRFEPNIYLKLENIGDVDLVNPRIVVNGRRNWFSADEIIASILRDDMADAEKAMAIFMFTSSIEVQAHDNNRRVGPPVPSEIDSEVGIRPEPSHPSRSTFKERANPVKAANCYYCSGCSLGASNFVILCRHARLTARAVWLCPLDTYQTHCVAEAWYDGGWHLFDPECRTFYLEESNMTIASYEMVHRNPAIVARTHEAGFSSVGSTPHTTHYEQFYPPCIMPVEQWLSAMDMTLRPGECFIWRWDHINKYRYGKNPRNKSDLVPFQLANGKFVYRPLFRGRVFWDGLVSAQNIESVDEGDRVILRPEVTGFPGFMIYKVTSPYPIVGGRISAVFSRRTNANACGIYISAHDSDWIEIWSMRELGVRKADIAIDEFLRPKETTAGYSYYLRFEVRTGNTPDDVSVSNICIETDVQMTATALPALSVGKNEVAYSDESEPERRVRITHGWRESSESIPPPASAGAVSPGDGDVVDLACQKKLVWQAAECADDDVIDYHVQVSSRTDMMYPVSPNFDRIIFSDKPEWELPEGWLVSGNTYYWRVRAKNAWGAWSPWSNVWRFEIQR